jgi:Tol biopolymer transport system component
MNTLLAAIGVTAISTVATVCLHAEAQTLAQAPIRSLCSTYAGPAFIGPDESRNTIVLHAGSFLGISFLSLDTGRTEAQISVPQRFLAGSISPHGETFTLAESENSGIRIASFDVTSREPTSSRIFGNLNADLSAFTPNGMYLLGVTNTGNVFRIDTKTSKREEIEGAGAKAQAIAISPNGSRLYIAGERISVIDVDHFSVASTLTKERLLLGIAVSPDNRTLAVRNWHGLELLDAANGNQVDQSIAVDAAPSAVSASSVNIAFSPDGSQMFYASASDSESDLISFSLNPLRIEKRSKVSPYSSAIAVVPGRKWVLLTTGTPGKEQIEAFDMKTLAVIFKAALTGDSASNWNSRQNGCADTRHSG